jgi:hypothetical protein
MAVLVLRGPPFGFQLSPAIHHVPAACLMISACTAAAAPTGPGLRFGEEGGESFTWNGG